jgi:hypothetical protein
MTSIKDQCSAAYQEALSAARRLAPRGFLTSRGRHFKMLKGDQVIAGECDSWPWDGTVAKLKQAILEAVASDADALYVEGGVDWRESPGDDYSEPWLTEWTVTVWEREA